MKDELGRDVAEPLRRGGNHCMFHARPFCTIPAEDFTGAAIILMLDLETSGLDVTRNLVVEIAACEAPSHPAALGASFATVVAGASGDASAVHGISLEEIAQGPRFSEAWSRFVAFADGLIDSSLQEESSESEDDGSPRPPRPPSEPPDILIVAHNGVRFDFAMLLFECQRHSVSWAPLERWLFVDTLDVLRAFGAEGLGGCQKLQCLARIAGGADGLRAHRALDDCVALRGVMECVAARLGSSCLLQLLRPFAVRLDAAASMASVSVLCEP